MSFDEDHLKEFSENCEQKLWGIIWWCSDILVLTIGMTANVALLWLLLRDIKAMSASKVLGLNLALMDILYLSLKPFGVVIDATQILQMKQNLSLELDGIMERNNSTISPLELAKDIFDMLNLVGCPLLLACMCIERYLAVAKPVLYRRAANLEYRMAISAIVWFITSGFCVVACSLRNFTLMQVPISAVISVLFIIMLTCLGGVMRLLRQQSPAHTMSGNPAHIAPQKAQAVKNVLLVVVPSVISYLPVLAMFPLVFYIAYAKMEMNSGLCNILEFCMLFPKLGVLIGPLFYFSKVRQVFCLYRTRE